MATKNLARTVIEGGRTGSYKTEIAMTSSAERAAERSYLQLVRNDPEAADGLTDPIRDPVYKSFADKLHPIRRFLDSRVGKIWADTYSEITSKFDIRTTPGRHIINDHMMSDIALPGEREVERTFYRYFVDDEGILRKNDEYGRPRPRRPQFDPTKLLAWLGNRKVGQQGERLVWWVPVNPGARLVAIWYDYSVRYGYAYAKNGKVEQIPNMYRVYNHQPTTIPNMAQGEPYRPMGLLKTEDERFFRSLPEHAQKAVLSAAPSHGDAKGSIHHNEPLPRY